MLKPDISLLAIRARKIGALLTSFFFLKAFLRGGVAPAIEHRSALRGVPFGFVVDVGANRGQFSLLCRRLNPIADIVAFEPLAEPAKIYRTIFAGDQRISLHNCALGVTRDEVMMNVSGRDDASSLLPISRAQVENFPGTEAVGSRLVTIAPLLDFITPAQMPSRSLLKIDVQGFELEVLKSAGPLLPCFEWVYVECSYVLLYEGQALAEEIVGYLRDNGFVLSGQFNPSYARRGGHLLQADLLFVRDAN